VGEKETGSRKKSNRKEEDERIGNISGWSG
jgi:hypothetical protein